MTTNTKSSSRNKEAKLQKANSAYKALLSELKAENLRLQKRIATLEAKHVSDLNRIKVLAKLKDPRGGIRRDEYLSDEEIRQNDEAIRKLYEAIRALGLEKGQALPVKNPKP